MLSADERLWIANRAVEWSYSALDRLMGNRVRAELAVIRAEEHGRNKARVELERLGADPADYDVLLESRPGKFRGTVIFVVYVRALSVVERLARLGDA